MDPQSTTLDCYKIIGLPSTCSQAEIKTAYRTKALLYHPDKNPGDNSATVKFQQLQDAYETLKYPQKRNTYDAAYNHAKTHSQTQSPYKTASAPRRTTTTFTHTRRTYPAYQRHWGPDFYTQRQRNCAADYQKRREEIWKQEETQRQQERLAQEMKRQQVVRDEIKRMSQFYQEGIRRDDGDEESCKKPESSDQYFYENLERKSKIYVWES